MPLEISTLSLIFPQEDCTWIWYDSKLCKTNAAFRSFFEVQIWFCKNFESRSSRPFWSLTKDFLFYIFFFEKRNFWSKYLKKYNPNLDVWKSLTNLFFKSSVSVIFVLNFVNFGNLLKLSSKAWPISLRIFFLFEQRSRILYWGSSFCFYELALFASGQDNFLQPHKSNKKFETCYWIIQIY